MPNVVFLSMLADGILEVEAVSVVGCLPGNRTSLQYVLHIYINKYSNWQFSSKEGST